MAGVPGKGGMLEGLKPNCPPEQELLNPSGRAPQSLGFEVGQPWLQTPAPPPNRCVTSLP